MPKELNDEYLSICEQIAAFFEVNFSTNEDIIKQSNILLEHLLKIFQTGDFIKMADTLYYTVKPILIDEDDAV